jgi:hypothetical protein
MLFSLYVKAKENLKSLANDSEQDKESSEPEVPRQLSQH